jgi:two-component sensor histidine kinase
LTPPPIEVKLELRWVAGRCNEAPVQTVRRAMGRIGAVLARHALTRTANYLEDNSYQVIDGWIGRLRDSVPGYAPMMSQMRDWGRRNLTLLEQLLLSEQLADDQKILCQLQAEGRELASLHLDRGIPLHEILRAISLFRISVLNAVERMLRSRVWTAFPSDLLKAEDAINEAIDQQMLVASEAYLAARDRQIEASRAEMEASNEKLKVLVQEMHHRIKNNLQTVSDLLTLEMRSRRRASPDDCLRESIARIRSIAAVHDLLSAQNVRMADIKELAEMIAENCTRSASSPDGVGILVQGESVLLPSKQATALALVLTELVNNALEHAFDVEGGTLLISLEASPREVVVSVRDNGKGLPEGFSIERGSHLGLQIVRTLVTKDLSGTIELRSNGGTTATVRFTR